MTEWAEDELEPVGSQGPGKEAQGRGERLPGVHEGEKQPSAVAPSLEGVVYQGGWERSWPDLEGSSVGQEQD